MLNSRIIQASLGNVSSTISTTRGCPQGGVLSPLLWTILVDELIWTLNSLGFITICYADDIVIIIIGTDDKIIRERMQLALKITWEWCEKHSLSINPNKTSIIIFTHRHKVDINPLFIKDVEIPFSKETKYLGVILDNKFNWNAHLNYITKKAISNLWTMKQLVCKSFGLRPSMCKYLYNQTNLY